MLNARIDQGTSLVMSRYFAMSVRRLATVAAIVCVVFAGVVSVAAGAHAGKAAPLPTATASAVVTGTSVTITVDVSTAPSKIPGASCNIDSVIVPCGVPVAVGTKASRYTITQTVGAGSHTFVYAIWTGSASNPAPTLLAETTFTVAGTPQSPQDLCTSLGGSYQAGFTAWHCTFAEGTAVPQSALADRCYVGGGYPSLETNGLNCAWPEVAQAKSLCSATATGSGYTPRFFANDGTYVSRWDCTTDNASADLAPFQASCSAIAGRWSVSVSGIYRILACSTPPPF